MSCFPPLYVSVTTTYHPELVPENEEIRIEGLFVEGRYAEACNAVREVLREVSSERSHADRMVDLCKGPYAYTLGEWSCVNQSELRNYYARHERALLELQCRIAKAATRGCGPKQLCVSASGQPEVPLPGSAPPENSNSP